MKVKPYTLLLLIAVIALSGWGSKGHRRISQYMAPALPATMSFLGTDWTAYVAGHASDADYRKEMDPNESPRHYIDIDNYPEFVQTGRIPQTFDSIVAKYGYSFVIGEGILPWATQATFDSLKSCFQRRDWNRSAYFAADLGHYVGDGHMPLHITANYNGQMTGQYGIHSRYETSMISRYESQLSYVADTAIYLTGSTNDYIFNYLYTNHLYVDSVLEADNSATSLTGSTNSDAYYQALWEGTGEFTIRLMGNASHTLATLIYTAWVQAGSPVFNPSGMGEAQPVMLTAYPNPADRYVIFPVKLNAGNHAVLIEVYDRLGNKKEELTSTIPAPGPQTILLDTSHYSPGVYYCRLTGDGWSMSGRFVVAR